MPQHACIFCAIIQGSVPAHVITENDDIIVIKDIAPKAPIHYLIIPKKHVTDIAAFEDNDFTIAGNMLFMAKKLASQLSGSQAFRLVVNNGADVGQKVFHSHMHFLSGKEFVDF